MKISKIDSRDVAGSAFKLFWFVVILNVTFQLVSDVTAAKVVQLGPAVVSVTVLYFPITYLISDVLTEVYGYERARRALWITMAASVGAGLIYQLVAYLPPGPGFELDQSYRDVFGIVPRVLVAGWIAVISGDLSNNFIMSRMKVRTKGHFLWMRTISSTIVGQGVNTVVFYVGALYGILPTEILMQAILWGWWIKVGVEVLLTPVTYLVIARLKKVEDLDVYDYHANYNPLKI